MRTGLRPFALLVALALAATTGAEAQNEEQLRLEEQRRREELSRVDRELGALRARRGELDGQAAREAQERETLQTQLVQAGRAARDNEAALAALEETLEQVTADLAQRRTQLAARRTEIALLTGALQGLSTRPEGGDLARLFGLGPTGPVETVRGGLLMGAAVPNIAERARVLAGDLAEIERVEREVRRQRAGVQAASVRLGTERRDLDRLVERKQALERQLGQDGRQAQARADRLAAQARDLRELVDRLAEQRRREEIRRLEEERLAEERRRQTAGAAPGRPTPPPVEVAVRPDVSARGGHTMPVSGRLVSGFGQTVDGSAARGLTVQTRSESLAVAPAAGRIVFAGPFRGYGRMLIIEHPDGYHSLLSGLGRIDGSVGESVRAGEPVGRAGSSAEGGGSPPPIYFELRRNGQPVNPAGWLNVERAR